MTWQIALVLFVLVAMLASFIWERIPAELTALAGLCILIASGVLSTDQALASFSNSAPIAVGAMFVLSAALEKGGAIQILAKRLKGLGKRGAYLTLPALVLVVAAVSAFINNTPVVVVFLPVVLSLAKQMEVPASKLLIPLSYASIFGGTCTLIGTSTNIVVSSVAQANGLRPLSMFELAGIGVPLLITGTLYLVLYGYRILPHRETLTSILNDEERREYMLEGFIAEDSPLIGRSLSALTNFKGSGLRPLEVIRHGVSIQRDPLTIELHEGDRILVAASARVLSQAHASADDSLSSLLGAFGMEPIAAAQGSLIEVAIRAETELADCSFNQLNFRQRYRLAPIAIHRNNINLEENIANIPLRAGDILLLVGSTEAIQALRQNPDFVVIDETPMETKQGLGPLLLSVATIAGVIIVSSFGLIPIAGAAIIGSVFLLLCGCLTTQEAYKSIHWPILFIIFAMLGVSQALDSSGASRLIAQSLVSTIDTFVTPAWQPLVLLAGIYLITTTLTEVLSNNATAVLMTSLAIGAAEALGVDARPFIIAVAAAASASFATPIGYQTNTYVYGIGGYRFTDFMKIGIPLNIVSFIIALVVIPLLWSF
ncbi:SLC13 family permease [Pelagicoccus sp. SDUM812003]|uniref:SLC13 family permease n=1 Tax=Pelagicoccus sp. SDUM812003 TaxID=3041267 RepID=UPI00280F5557|nr:SLC13 family permease [Pelagicoccus sp. SDUM812003]MDQ8204187.1 SLC13 family permease [Pelagicoccus sp. SDUM812003]